MASDWEKAGGVYFVYDNPEHQGGQGPNALITGELTVVYSGWYYQCYRNKSGQVRIEKLNRVEGFCDPAYKAPRVKLDRLKVFGRPNQWRMPCGCAKDTGTKPEPYAHGWHCVDRPFYNTLT